MALGGTRGGAADVPQPAPGASPDNAAMVSLVQLIAEPEAFDGRYVKIIGFLHLEFEGDAIWLHREDCEHRIYKNGLWVHTGQVLRPADARYNDRYVMIVGRFDAQKHGHLGLWSGEINSISRVSLWPPPKPAAGGLVPAKPAERQVNAVVTGQVVPAAVKAGEPIPLTVRISNGLRAPIFHDTFRLEPVDWNGETVHISLVDIYRDGVAYNLYLARPAFEGPPWQQSRAGPGGHEIKPGGVLEVKTDARKWTLRDGWLPGRYSVTLRVDGLRADPYCKLSVLSDSFEFEVK